MFSFSLFSEENTKAAHPPNAFKIPIKFFQKKKNGHIILTSGAKLCYGVKDYGYKPDSAPMGPTGTWFSSGKKREIRGLGGLFPCSPAVQPMSLSSPFHEVRLSQPLAWRRGTDPTPGRP